MAAFGLVIVDSLASAYHFSLVFEAPVLYQELFHSGRRLLALRENSLLASCIYLPGYIIISIDPFIVHLFYGLLLCQYLFALVVYILTNCSSFFLLQVMAVILLIIILSDGTKIAGVRCGVPALVNLPVGAVVEPWEEEGPWPHLFLKKNSFFLVFF